MQVINSLIYREQLDTDPLKVLVPKLSKFTTDFKSQIDNIHAASGLVKQNENKIANSVDEKLDLASALMKVDIFWTKASNRSENVTKNLSDTLQILNENLTNYVPYLKISLFVLGTLFILHIVIAAAAMGYILYEAIEESLLSSEPIGKYFFAKTFIKSQLYGSQL